MNRNSSILTNMDFHQSQNWRTAVTTICRTGESPDDLGAWRQALRLLRLRSRFDVVVTMAPRPSLLYGLICGLLHLPSKQIMVEVFPDSPRPASLSWRVKTALFRWISRRSFGILTNSSAEVGFMARRFGLPADKLRFVPMYTTIESPALSPDNDGYVYSIGRTLRDLDTLLQAAPLFQAPLVLVAGKDDAIPHPAPAGTQVLRELPLEEGYEKMRRAAVVVIPLLPAERSTGQVVLFEAMAMGKPVVATRVTGTVELIRNRFSGARAPARLPVR
ncbi:MAG TPA: glycosyltransferase, partial [Kiritimatiellia bacterium]|nr:glycosyltransferase [Kiritimatiellia bacterium]